MKSSEPTIAVIMITLNEAHNLPDVFNNLRGFADEMLILDSHSSDDSVEIARKNGAKVFLRKFTGFGDQWNYAVNELPTTSQWVMKLDPDERLTDELKHAIKNAIAHSNAAGFKVTRRLWFMGKPLPIFQQVLRVWKVGACHFTNVSVNEHPIVEGKIETLAGHLEHYDSPDLHHWMNKQNQYTSTEAQAKFTDTELGIKPSLFGDGLSRRMWIKKHFSKLPLRHRLVFLYCFFVQGAWRAGKAGYIWSRLRADVYRMREYKLLEMRMRQEVQSRQAEPAEFVSINEREIRA